MEFKWDEKYVLGINEIDKQHKKLIDISHEINKLIKTEDSPQKHLAIMTVITELEEFTRYHFKYEEELMRKKGYKDLEEHIEIHKKFILYLKNLDLSLINQDQYALLKELNLFVNGWIIEHIENEDKKYVKTLLT